MNFFTDIMMIVEMMIAILMKNNRLRMTYPIGWTQEKKFSMAEKYEMK